MQIYVLKMSGVNTQILLAQSDVELAYRLYAAKIDKPNQQLFLDPTASISTMASVGDETGDLVVLGAETHTVQDYLDIASSMIFDKKGVEVYPNGK